MALYDVQTDYNGRKVTMHSDPDRFVFVNHKGFTWENGVPLTTEEIVGFLKYFGKKKVAGELGAGVAKDLCFLDSQQEYYMGYGLDIAFDDNGEPQYRIVDGKILSSRIPCECETRSSHGLVLSTRENYQKDIQRFLTESLLTLNNKDVVLNYKHYIEYRCTKCGELYLFPPDIYKYPEGSRTIPTRRKTIENYLAKNGPRLEQERKYKKIRHAIFSVLALLVIAGVILLVVLACNS